MKCDKSQRRTPWAPYQIHAGKSGPIVSEWRCHAPSARSSARLYDPRPLGVRAPGPLSLATSLSLARGLHEELPRPSCTFTDAAGVFKKLLSHINKTFGTLAFCRRWLERPDGSSWRCTVVTRAAQESSEARAEPLRRRHRPALPAAVRHRTQSVARRESDVGLIARTGRGVALGESNPRVKRAEHANSGARTSSRTGWPRSRAAA